LRSFINHQQRFDSAATLAVRDFLQAIGFKYSFEAKLPVVARNKIALKVMLEHEPKLEEQVANVYAARFTADELRAAGTFYRTATGTLYATFNREIAANPYATPEIVRAEIDKRLTSQQRGEVFTYLSGGAGKKMIGILPDLLKAEKEVTEQWSRSTQEDVDRAVRAGEEVSSGEVRTATRVRGKEPVGEPPRGPLVHEVQGGPPAVKIR
jgi:uncharacterized protein DUF2059